MAGRFRCIELFLLFHSVYLLTGKNSAQTLRVRNHIPASTTKSTDGLSPTKHLTFTSTEQTTPETAAQSSTSTENGSISTETTAMLTTTISQTNKPNVSRVTFTSTEQTTPETAFQSSTEKRSLPTETAPMLTTTISQTNKHNVSSVSLTSTEQTTPETADPSSTENGSISTETPPMWTTTISPTNKPNVSSVSTKTTHMPTLSTVDIPKYNSTLAMMFNISINTTFQRELNDPTSEMYTHYETEFSSALRSVFSALPEFGGILINGFRNGSITCTFILQLNGMANLSTLEDDFNKCLDKLRNKTVDGVTIDINEKAMQAEYSSAVSAQNSGSSCNGCPVGYACTFLFGMFSCRHVCELVADFCSERGGCLYDPILYKPTCRCSESFTSCGSDSKKVNYGAILGGSIGGPIGALVMFIIYQKCRTQDGNSDRCVFNPMCNCCSDDASNTSHLQGNGAGVRGLIGGFKDLMDASGDSRCKNKADAPPKYSEVDPNK